MEWYWWVVIVIAVIVILRTISKSSAPQRDRNRPDDLYAAVMEGRQNAARRVEQQSAPLNPELKPYLTRLCKVYATHYKTFASSETRTIGQEISSKFGRGGMLAVHEGVRQALGSGPARDLEYQWSGIGEWLG